MISITHGIFNGIEFYKRDGYWHDETQVYLPLSVKFRDLILKKFRKFNRKYGIKGVRFTYAKDLDTDIDAITICHSRFDFYNEKIGENIVIGRIKRMRGEIRTPYNMDKRYRIKQKDGTFIDGELMYPWIDKLEK